MEKKKQTRFRVYGTKEEYDKIFAEIKALPKQWEPKQITEFIQNKLTLSILLCMTVQEKALMGMPIHRVRVQESNPIDESRIEEFGYPPAEFCCEGRANRKGEQVFYASADMHTAIFEKAESITPNESVVYLSSWEIVNDPGDTLMRNLFYGVRPDEYEEQDYAAIMIKGLQDVFDKMLADAPEKLRENYTYGQKLYNDLFSSGNRDHYHLSSALAHATFNEAHSQGINIPILTFPSVAKKRRAINFVFRKNFADRHLRLKEVFKIVVTEVAEGKVSFNPVRRGVPVDNERLAWSDLEVKLRKFENSLLISFEEEPRNFTRIASDEILTCCPKHSFTAAQYIEQFPQFKESHLFEAIESEGVHLDLSSLPLYEDKFVFAPVEQKIFFKDKLKSERQIRFIGMPITYTAGFGSQNDPDQPFKTAS